MRKIMMIAIALFALNATAQGPKNKKGAFKDLSTEEIATLKTKKMTLHLDLTESQQEKVKILILEEVKQKEKLRAERKEKVEGETKKELTKEERYTMANERLDKQIEMKKKMKNILNEEQYKKWETTLAKKGKRKHKKLHKNKPAEKQ